MRGDSILGNAVRVGKVNDCCSRVPANTAGLRSVGGKSAYHRDNLIVVCTLLNIEGHSRADQSKQQARVRWG